MEVPAVFLYNIAIECKKQAHAVYYTRYHIVISTKYRRKVLKAGIDEYLKKKVQRINKFHPEIEVLEVNTDLDHIHLVMFIPPKFSVSKVVNMVKTNTCNTMRRKFSFLDKVYWDLEGIWSMGYFVSTVGISEETIRKYVQKQGQEDSGQAKLEF